MTNVQTQLKRADEFSELWGILMPDVTSPERQQFLIWCGTYSDDHISRGISRAAAKVRSSQTPMTHMDAVRYAASVMRREQFGEIRPDYERTHGSRH